MTHQLALAAFLVGNLAAGAVARGAPPSDAPAEAEAAQVPPADAPPADPDADPTGDPDEVIVVTGTRSPTPLAASPVTTEVIDRKHIVESGARTAADALSTRAGIFLERGLGGVGVSIQGLGPAYVLVLVDGQRQLGRTDGAVDLERFAAANLEQIEIVRGPGSALYGSDALGGVINLVSRAPEQERAELAVRADHRGGTDLSAQAGGGSPRVSGALVGGWRQSPAYDRSPDTAGTTIAGFSDAQGGARARYRRGERWRIDGSGSYQRRDLHGVDGSATGAVLDRHNLVEDVATAVDARWYGERTTGSLHLGGSYYRDQFAQDQRGSSALDQYQDTREHLIELGAQVDRKLGERHRLTTGGEVLAEALRSERLSEEGSRTRAALYVQDEWRIGEAYRVLVVPAVRLDADTQFGSHVTPRLAVRWDPTDAVVARAAVGMGYRAPGFKDLYLRFENPGVGYVIDGNPALSPETSVSVQGGVEWKPRPWAWVAANAYVNDLHDLITAVTFDDGLSTGTIRFSYDNIGRARTMGGDVATTVARGRLSAELGYAYTRARDLELDTVLDGIPAHRVNGALRWRDEVEGLTAAVEITATGPRSYGGVDTERRLDVRARVARRFGERLELAMGADNLLDRGDDSVDRIPPLTLYLAVTARL